MKDFIEVGGCIFIAMGAYFLLSTKVREKWLPIAFSCLLFWDGGGNAFLGMINTSIYYLGWISHVLAMGLVLSEFKVGYFNRNGAMSAFLLFMCYYTVAGLLGEGSYGELIAYHFRIFRMVVIGLIIGMWTRRVPGGFSRLLKTVAVSIFVLSILYVKFGSWSVSAMLEQEGRMVVDTASIAGEESQIRSVFNVNRFALLTTMLLPYVVILLTHTMDDCRWGKLYKFIGAFCCIVLSVVCIKTGSRNGGVGLLAIAWYFIFGKSTMNFVKRLALFIMLGIIFCGMVVLFMSGSELRAFQLKTEKEKGGSFEELGTGRGGIFLNLYDSMTPSERIFGKGVVWYYSPLTGERFANNAHSIYFDIIIHSGWVGFSLFMLFCSTFIVSARRSGRRKNVAMLFWLVWVLTGIGEAANISPSSGYAKYGLGIALALCSKRRFGNEIEWESYTRKRIWQGRDNNFNP